MDGADRRAEEDCEADITGGNCQATLRTAGSVKTSNFSMIARLLAVAFAFHWSLKEGYALGGGLPGEDT